MHNCKNERLPIWWNLSFCKEDLILFYRFTLNNHFGNIGENKFAVLVKHFEGKFDKPVFLISLYKIGYGAGA